MNTQVVLIVCAATASVAATLGAVAYHLLRFLHQRDQVKLARYALDKTGSTDGLEGYTELCRIEQPVIIQVQRAASGGQVPSGPQLPPSDSR